MWVCPHARYSDGDAHWRNRLREGLEQNISLVIAKAVLGLIGEGLDYRALVRDALRCSGLGTATAGASGSPFSLRLPSSSPPYPRSAPPISRCTRA